MKVSDEIKEKYKDERIKLILEIMALAYLVNEHTEYCIFIRYSGHVDSLDIQITENKERYNTTVCESEFKTHFHNLYDFKKETEDNYLAWLKAKKETLKDILDYGEIDYSDMTEHIETYASYSF